MVENLVNPTYYSLQKAILTSEFSPGIGEIDITGLIPSLTITSSMSSETVYGSFRIIDTVGLLDDLPLRGEEKLTFELADSIMLNSQGSAGPTSQVQSPFILVAFIYKIDNVIIDRGFVDHMCASIKHNADTVAVLILIPRIQTICVTAVALPPVIAAFCDAVIYSFHEVFESNHIMPCVQLMLLKNTNLLLRL